MKHTTTYNLDPSQYSYASPLDGWNERSNSGGDATGGGISEAYDRFLWPVSNGRPDGAQLPGFHVHIYFSPNDSFQTKFASELWQRVRSEFPELHLFPISTAPEGPHSAGMFEVHIFTPAQFGAFVSWLVIHRGPLSAFLHPNTDDELRDHIQRYTWLGPEVPLNMDIFKLRPSCELLDSRDNSVVRVWVEADKVKTERIEAK
ncbi:DOPA-like domain-containing protein [Aspergillus avenaceus]|uniref:DOPA-like domain-containing protein n=1 Tax=Aspergillus avenaceus TaxID=36643 RepID=A0A5N6TKL9_ASPAV|nr:DOPA-like domain-containing protein [Aspergillus avenaceus]